ncbi:MAG: hypothetical protein K2X47_01275, partial [Bdellovibrionales bacterium]|nr:hypothetical protein [Bdellovibrionales bacterium]
MQAQRVALILIVLLGAGCSYRRDKETSVKESRFNVLGVQLSYSQIKQGILQPKCLGCHSGQDLPDLTSYENVIANLPKIQERVINLKTMPKKQPLEASLISALKAWIDAGAPKESATPVGLPVPVPTSPEGVRTVVTWNEVNRRLIQPYCVSCHTAGN